VRYPLKTPSKNGTTHLEFESVELMAHIPVRHPAGDLRPSKSAILPICHRQTRGIGTATACAPDPILFGLALVVPAQAGIQCVLAAGRT